jgi:hypothetical protein
MGCMVHNLELFVGSQWLSYGLIGRIDVSIWSFVLFVFLDMYAQVFSIKSLLSPENAVQPMFVFEK